MKWRFWTKTPSTGRVAAAEALADQHLAEAQEYLEAAEARVEAVRAEWPAIRQGRAVDEAIIATNSLTSRFLRQIHKGGHPA